MRIALIALTLLCSACAKQSGNVASLYPSLKSIPDDHCSVFTNGGKWSFVVPYNFNGVASKAYNFDCGMRDNGQRCYYLQSVTNPGDNEIICGSEERGFFKVTL